MIPVALSIAGFDGTAGAGMQADLKVFSALECYGMTVLTALPVQNTCGVRSCHEIPAHCVEEQLFAIFEDTRPHAIKIGMLFTEAIIHRVADFLHTHARDIPLVVDPVMYAKSGDALLQESARAALKDCILPLATLITPNAPEATHLTGIAVEDVASQQEAAEVLLKLGAKAALVKGGHVGGDASGDWFADCQGETHLFQYPRIKTPNTHGTGCTLSAAITAGLAHGLPLVKAVEQARAFLQQALLAAKDWRLGKGCGPLHHFHAWWPSETARVC
ncbi:bifunctional hydroxy-methylpyrimidine kinase and hydroxy-phosphomethylpyrimidine kinase [Legionella geestiana]|uniref:hydroxymethylpyrimidine kinase n=1 Tax=Legionella geestiana TaxID=45065 RepID=A0A0W0TQT8_9GAMM|nr:bifunctional hydroxymethylpyrimidine kinase/phosphomethylpyrimidine kinase [Legionella geestiana]KTC97897.1 bifunctional hydroxy-methylpyrimidine kinase and hydroxy-phosphomethylpyrimidine kinase [Legionella geestiana]QBS11754.1 bifunctional hydroxymethylpyrimidine kinase/phosphomethylpyrimidine kinase [Legionella geestiana]STX53555.1 bifunctional hydroxy-methylpyrimidine kinase and hydroxy-phosphomethylpyrimidine kinase [Legionella geestiana]